MSSKSNSVVESILWGTLAALVTISMTIKSADRNRSKGMEEMMPHLPNGSINVTSYDTEGNVRFNVGNSFYTAKPEQELSAEDFGPVAGTNFLKMIQPGSIRQARVDTKASGGR